MKQRVKSQYVFYYPHWDQVFPFHITDASIVFQVSKVLRMKKKDPILLLNGEGGKLLCQIEGMDSRAIFCTPLEYSFSQPKDSFFHMIVGTPKKEALKDIIKYSTQLGVSSIYMVDMEFSQTKGKELLSAKKEYWERLLIESLEQSMGSFLPRIHIGPSLLEVVKERAKEDLYLVADTHTFAPCHLVEMIKGDIPANVFIIIGPEGGFSPKERALFKEYGLSSFHLVETILRVETAVLSTLVAMQVLSTSQTLKSLPGQHDGQN